MGEGRKGTSTWEKEGRVLVDGRRKEGYWYSGEGRKGTEKVFIKIENYYLAHKVIYSPSLMYGMY